MMTYTRVPLSVEVLFSANGRLKPQKLYYAGIAYDITRVVSVRNYCPQVVACIAPVEYTVQIDGIYKKIYYEADTATWFSVKESSDA